MGEVLVAPSRPGDIVSYVPFGGEVAFTWDYRRSRQPLVRLYEKAKTSQWNVSSDLDWSVEVDPTAQNMPDAQIPIFGTPVWEKLSNANQVEVRHHTAAWLLSQFLHGEQGALLCTAKVTETVPWIDAKCYAATQVMDEARHVEVYARYLDEKIQLSYPVNPHLESLLDQIIADSRWDMTYLGMQIMVEGLALAAFGLIHQLTAEPLLKEITRLVMADEARHVAFGVLSLKDYYPELTDAERREREDFAFEAGLLMRNRFLAEEVWDNLGLPRDACLQAIEASQLMDAFRKVVFSRIMPNLNKLGLLTDRVRPRWAELGVLEFAQAENPEDLAAALGS